MEKNVKLINFLSKCKSTFNCLKDLINLFSGKKEFTPTIAKNDPDKKIKISPLVKSSATNANLFYTPNLTLYLQCILIHQQNLSISQKRPQALAYDLL